MKGHPAVKETNPRKEPRVYFHTGFQPFLSLTRTKYLDRRPQFQCGYKHDTLVKDTSKT